MKTLNFSSGNQKIAHCNCLPTIVDKHVDNYRQACSQLSAGLFIIVGSKTDRLLWTMTYV